VVVIEMPSAKVPVYAQKGNGSLAIIIIRNAHSLQSLFHSDRVSKVLIVLELCPRIDEPVPNEKNPQTVRHHTAPPSTHPTTSCYHRMLTRSFSAQELGSDAQTDAYFRAFTGIRE